MRKPHHFPVAYSWSDSLPHKFYEDGTANWIVAAYIMAYTMVEIWVILQVHVPQVLNGIVRRVRARTFSGS